MFAHLSELDHQRNLKFSPLHANFPESSMLGDNDSFSSSHFTVDSAASPKTSVTQRRTFAVAVAGKAMMNLIKDQSAGLGIGSPGSPTSSRTRGSPASIHFQPDLPDNTEKDPHSFSSDSSASSAVDGAASPKTSVTPETSTTDCPPPSMPSKRRSTRRCTMKKINYYELQSQTEENTEGKVFLDVAKESNSSNDSCCTNAPVDIHNEDEDIHSEVEDIVKVRQRFIMNCTIQKVTQNLPIKIIVNMSRKKKKNYNQFNFNWNEGNHASLAVHSCQMKPAEFCKYRLYTVVTSSDNLSFLPCQPHRPPTISPTSF